MFRALIPSPPLSIALLVVWLVLNQSVHPATVLFGALLAIVVPLINKGLRPPRCACGTCARRQVAAGTAARPRPRRS